MLFVLILPSRKNFGSTSLTNLEGRFDNLFFFSSLKSQPAKEDLLFCCYFLLSPREDSTTFLFLARCLP